MKKYTIGIDYGTLSGRCVLVDVQTGQEVAECVSEYAHKVMDSHLPDGTPLGIDWALQHPEDYLDVLRVTIRGVIEKAGINASQIVGVGVDFTSCTILPIKMDGTPLCFMDKYASNPNAYVKLWKHHAAQVEADELNRIAKDRGESFLSRYGGKISSEWLFPKLWQILKQDPQLYDEMDCFIEAGDWVVMCLTGKMTRNTCAAGYKAIWSKREGYPSKDFFKALDPRMENVVEEKLRGEIVAIGTKVGEITPAAAELTGLCPGTAVAAAHLDAGGALPGAGICSTGVMLALMGTSTCHMMLGEGERYVPGICGYAEDGMIRGYVGYEAGQSCVGDHFQWMTENCVPPHYFEAAAKEGKNIHAYLSEKAAQLLPGESGLVALDWWNGNRSILVDGKLSGLIIGCNLQTKPEEIYRALVEATAFGTRMIIENYEEHDVPVQDLVIAGGIAQKNPFIMQLYADITGKEIKIAGSTQNSALSCAIWGAVAAGKDQGGYDTLEDAVERMANKMDKSYVPNKANSEAFTALYEEYKILHDYFGRGANDVMKRLKNLSEQKKKEHYDSKERK